MRWLIVALIGAPYAIVLSYWLGQWSITASAIQRLPR